jgi:hypothetical protein
MVKVVVNTGRESITTCFVSNSGHHCYYILTMTQERGINQPPVSVGVGGSLFRIRRLLRRFSDLTGVLPVVVGFILTGVLSVVVYLGSQRVLAPNESLE